MASNDDIMEILVKLTEGQTEIKGSLNSMNNRLDKIELVQEEIKTKIITLGELHQAHGEQQERLFKVSDNAILEKIDISETSIKNVSSDVKQIKEIVEVLEEVTGKHEIKIKVLERRPV
ncbi:hypothetical protein [Clostridium psychrophilum]|uniref:hypothetical protein n=1 Tax=Clostridium psychrophilum TaxID=132926 RepID=UPI001C0C23DB|nr:hypothetical protein [Clostridium psychrophilum]MBU3182625.1 hypothetical protein [Clostridium psychrophilum]